MKVYERFDPKQDTFILSKGHAAAALYAVLESFGYSPTYKIHPDIDIENGIACTTGSLGHGFPIAAGMAYALKVQNKPGEVSVLMGDGECAEGTTWETALFAEQNKLYNLKIFIDVNKYQALGKTVYFEAPYHIRNAFPRLYIDIQHSIKGHPLSIFKDHPDWHVHPISAAEFILLMKEVEAL
jgi:transketolase